MKAVSGDFDDDPYTPDNVLVIDKNNIPRYIDGYSITPNTKRLVKITTTQQDKAQLASFDKVDKSIYKKWLKRYLTETQRQSHPYEQWKAIKLAKKPK
jgi:esterase/lipase superfamily enzyme